jgi:hypothetical protein
MNKKLYELLTLNESEKISQKVFSNPELINQKWIFKEIYYYKENFKTPKLDYCLSKKNLIKIKPFFKDLVYPLTGQN